MQFTNYSRMDLLTTAFGMEEDRILGPDWASSERYNIAAIVPQGETKEQIPATLATLLTDRFSLTLRHETKELTAYVLSPALGLTIQSKKMPVDVIVIGHVEKMPRIA